MASAAFTISAHTRARQRRVAQLRIALALAHVAQELGKRLHPHVGVGRRDALGDFGLAERAVRVRHLVEHAHVLGVIGDHVEVERRLDLHLPAAPLSVIGLPCAQA